MPVTQEQARHIIALAREYLPADRLYALLDRLERGVGPSGDADLRAALTGLRQAAEQQLSKAGLSQEPPGDWYTTVMLNVLVIAHLLFLAGHLVAFAYLLVLAPWYVVLPCCTFQILLILSDWKCPLTVLENRLRRRLGRRAVRGFVGHYLLSPNR